MIFESQRERGNPKQKMDKNPSDLQAPLIVLSSTEQSSRQSRFSRDEILEEVKKQLWLAGPLISVNFFTYLLQVISVMFVGHLGELPLAGASMATSFASVTAISLLEGMASALETLCGQSYGAKQHHLLGVHLQRAMIVLLLAAIPLSFVSGYAEPILLCFGQDPEIAAEAGEYARFVIPSVFGLAILEPHVRFLQSQNNVVPLTVTAGAATLVHVFVCWALVFRSGLGSRGAALANGVSYWINALTLFVYVRVSPTCKETWTGWSREAFQGIPEFVRLAIPSAIMLSLQTWSFEMMVLLGGLLPNPKLETSVLSIRSAACILLICCPFILGYFCSTRVSNELGAGRPRTAILAVNVALAMAMTEWILVGIVLVSGRNVWGYLYSKEERVVKYVAKMLLLIAACHLFDAIQAVLSGICRGCGKQKLGAVINLGAYYMIGIPCSILLAFVYRIGGKGLWIGIIIAAIFQALFFSVVTVKTSWEKEAKKAKDRVYGAIIEEQGHALS
ncbi:unnamed protein product [Linum tenue]|uniref:Protein DETOXIFICATION n=1 Tax=Linum tenue TaxID=586396 RepID=A0AAV0I8S7_9ROSI|nr:unnamed protein product [Linum tenue]